MSEQWTIRKVLDWTKTFLLEKGVENPRLETEWIIAASLGIDRVGIYVNFDKPLTDQELTGIRGMVARRGKREPLQYILGTEEFDGLEFKVNSSVLIPRHDTEILLEEAAKLISEGDKIVDIGTGSGCLAIALKKRFPLAKVTAVDISENALQTAAKNAENHKVGIEWIKSDLFSSLENRSFSIIISNPPYIPSSELDMLQPEVSLFEPRSALDGGGDGLDFYRTISEKAACYLENEGWLLVETGINESDDVRQLFSQSGLVSIFTALDNSGIERVVGGQFRK